MNLLYIIALLLLPIHLFNVGLPLLPINQIEADNIDFNEKVLTLAGNVSVSHEIGTLHCIKGILLLNDAKTPNNEIAVKKILLYENVSINFSDGSQLISDEGQLDCIAMEGVFTSKAPSKVVYTSYAQNDRQKIPVRASSHVLKAKIIKTPQGYALSSLKGEGAVTVEYLHPLDISEKQQEKSE